MSKALLYLILGLALGSCTNETNVQHQTQEESNDSKLDFETRCKRWVESALQMPATEKYDLKIYQEQMNDDKFLDAIITVNRLAFAIDDAASSSNTVQKAETGYLGQHNIVFYYDGKKDEFSRPIPIGSSAVIPLKVRFDTIQSVNYKSAIVDYRIRDAAYRNYFFVTDGSIHLALQHPLYTAFKTPDCKYYMAQLNEGRNSSAKDVVVYQADCLDNPPENLLDEFEPELAIKPFLSFHFFYLPAKRKYAVLKANEEQSF